MDAMSIIWHVVTPHVIPVTIYTTANLNSANLKHLAGQVY